MLSSDDKIWFLFNVELCHIVVERTHQSHPIRAASETVCCPWMHPVWFPQTLIGSWGSKSEGAIKYL
ncbi:hypothetical protein JOQ06_021205 [Pogonophryne albipinna]|uniref:Uncharacterized protein n=1 Tax=Pogonophryne albipinna TaxID=1090488 RepID=A0AAD6BVD7_9TELE|nr:hypothetical protein JOQ06_021205 [Pogonophryne albipinna]